MVTYLDFMFPFKTKPLPISPFVEGIVKSLKDNPGEWTLSIIEGDYIHSICHGPTGLKIRFGRYISSSYIDLYEFSTNHSYNLNKSEIRAIVDAADLYVIRAFANKAKKALEEKDRMIKEEFEKKVL